MIIKYIAQKEYYDKAKIYIDKLSEKNEFLLF